MSFDDWLPETQLGSERLLLEPLRLDHAEEMAPVLDDPGLHAFTGGEPASLAQLRSRYARQVVGHSDDESRRWLNWVARRRDDGRVVGFVQATVSNDGEEQLCAEVAWVIGTAQQQRGYAQDAAQLMVEWLRQRGVRVVIAHIHPDHHASSAVARRLGLRPTGDVVNGELRWRG